MSHTRLLPPGVQRTRKREERRSERFIPDEIGDSPIGKDPEPILSDRQASPDQRLRESDSAGRTPSGSAAPPWLADGSMSNDELVYRPIVIIEPHLDDDVLGGGSSDLGSGPFAELEPSDLLDTSGKLAVWRQSSSDRLLVADLLSGEDPIALKQLPRRAQPDGLVSVESHGLGLGGVFRNGRRYLLAIYSRSGEIRRTQPLNDHSLQALELKHQADLNRDGRVGPGRGGLTSALLSAPERGVLIQPLQTMPAWAQSLPAAVQDSVSESFVGAQSFGFGQFGSAELPLA